MQVQYSNPAKPAMIDGEWRSAKCDSQARLELVIASMPNASETGLATQTTLDELADQGRSADTITLANLAITAAPTQLPSIALTNGSVVSIKNPDGSGQTVFVGRAETIAAALNATQPTWPISEGDTEDFGGANANEWWVCATGAMTIAYRVEAKS